MSKQQQTAGGGITEEEHEKYFKDAEDNIKKHAFYMQRALDEENLHEALRHASTMINELRTSKLFPQPYYEIYMHVTNELHQLESYIEDEYKKKAILIRIVQMNG